MKPFVCEPIFLDIGRPVIEWLRLIKAKYRLAADGTIQVMGLPSGWQKKDGVYGDIAELRDGEDTVRATYDPGTLTLDLFD